MKVLERTQFGDPILRKKAKQLSLRQVLYSSTSELVADMRHTLLSKKLGVGLAAPQVGNDVAIAVVAIRPSKLRPKVKKFDLVLVNPVITKVSDKKKELWEGCISAGSAGKADLFAKVPRHTEIEVSYTDLSGKLLHKKFKGLKAQIIQHEVDHLNGILFVDRVEDTGTYMTYSEYLKRIKKHSIIDKQG